MLSVSSGTGWVTGLLPVPGLVLHAISKSTPILASNLGTLLFASYQLPEGTFSHAETIHLGNKHSGHTG